jgi:3-methyladenine DNA glycosylase Tag
MSLLNNAVDSIKVGVEDFEKGSRERLTSSVRNIHAGILLLYKEALKRLSPDDSNDVLIKRRIVPTRNKDDIVKFIGQGKTTVNVHQIRNRFDKLDIETDWEQFESISKIRNDIEHYYTEHDYSLIQHLIAKSFTIISSFIEKELKENPVDLLGYITWSTMLEVAGLYQKEREKCLNKINEISWGSEALTEGVQDITCVFCDDDMRLPMRGT